jgi:hypothetical protein
MATSSLGSPNDGRGADWPASGLDDTATDRRSAIQQRSDQQMSMKLDDDVQRLNMVAPAAWLKKIDDWRRKQPDLPSLSAAIRQLVELGLESSKKERRHDR